MTDQYSRHLCTEDDMEAVSSLFAWNQSFQLFQELNPELLAVEHDSSKVVRVLRGSPADKVLMVILKPRLEIRPIRQARHAVITLSDARKELALKIVGKHIAKTDLGFSVNELQSWNLLSVLLKAYELQYATY